MWWASSRKRFGRNCGSAVCRSRDKGKQDLVFFAAEKRADLRKLRALAGELKLAGALWVIYPKGVTAIREIEVIDSGRAAGLKDVKVCGFSTTHTGLKFVIPVASRVK